LHWPVSRITRQKLRKKKLGKKLNTKREDRMNISDIEELAPLEHKNFELALEDLGMSRPDVIYFCYDKNGYVPHDLMMNHEQTKHLLNVYNMALIAYCAAKHG
jgi:hypothetical protein